MDGSDRPGTVEEVLAHYGVKGMKWGVRRAKPSAGPPPSSDAVAAKATKAKIKAGGVKSLNNQELRTYLERMDLERRYNSSKPPTFKDETRKILRETLVNVGKQEMAKFAGKQVAKALAGRS